MAEQDNTQQPNGFGKGSQDTTDGGNNEFIKSLSSVLTLWKCVLQGTEDPAKRPWLQNKL